MRKTKKRFNAVYQRPRKIEVAKDVATEAPSSSILSKEG